MPPVPPRAQQSPNRVLLAMCAPELLAQMLRVEAKDRLPPQAVGCTARWGSRFVGGGGVGAAGAAGAAGGAGAAGAAGVEGA